MEYQVLTVRDQLDMIRSRIAGLEQANYGQQVELIANPGNPQLAQNMQASATAIDKAHTALVAEQARLEALNADSPASDPEEAVQAATTPLAPPVPDAGNVEAPQLPQHALPALPEPIPADAPAGIGDPVPAVDPAAAIDPQVPVPGVGDPTPTGDTSPTADPTVPEVGTYIPPVTPPDTPNAQLATDGGVPVDQGQAPGFQVPAAGQPSDVPQP